MRDFNKYGEIYGIEQPSKNSVYATRCLNFSDYEKAQEWAHENTVTYRYLVDEFGNKAVL
jgi:hypothetical protein